jgi:hypothetical protein
MNKIKGEKSGFVFQFMNSEEDESYWVSQLDSMYAYYKDRDDRCLGYQSGDEKRWIFAYTDNERDVVDVWFQEKKIINDR